ncbi:ankyrin repeats (3 copies) domain-containing protein [Trichoderma breve]|uniref:Ankyrin repeats (3 copies) domain-containing protein n=1 Tax=Trichoderma breve TaxID=2034170 RepID=A0A9W9E6U2_9HYPO|nr:ankyrin repeats (3 copies) domain-containing protein [Trichoderma breve]KAJ4859640.1 ankyrin repeats (3 copies) domain-containing protein [Trichoderma breve]
MDRMFNHKRPKDKNAKSKSRLSMFGRKKDRADQQAHDNGGTPEPSPLINSAFPNPNPIGSSNAPAQPSTSDTSSLSPDDEYQNTPIVELWNSAYEKLRKENKQLIDEYETKLQNSSDAALDPVPDTKEDRQNWMGRLLHQKMEQVQKDAWKFMFLGSEIRPAETVESVLRVIKMANDSITATVVPNPYASLACVGISVLLSICLTPSNQAVSLANEFKYVLSLIIQGRMREDLYQRRYEGQNKVDEPFLEAHSKYKSALENLYQQILRFQIHCYCYYTQSKASRLVSDFSQKNDWNGLVEDIRRQETQMAAIDKIWRDQRYDDESAASERRYQGTILNMKTIGANISSLREAVENANRDRNQQELLDWLCDIDPSDMYNAARKRHKAGTSEWLIKENAEFASWVQSPSSFLWLHGKAGCGKSVLSSSVIHHLQREFKDDASTAVVYFYFTFSDTTRQESDGMLASLIKQVCCHRPNIPDTVNDLGEYKKKGMRPSTEELQNSFISTLRGFTNVYIIIDALDECPNINTQREELLEILHYILDSNLNNLHMFCTSRKESDIDVSLQIERDIGEYIDSTLTNAKYSSWPILIKAEVRKALIEKSDGMFQYIRCQFEALQKLRSPRDIRRALEDLPKGLDETYDRMLQGIDDRYRKSVANSLKWLAFSMQPLTVDELAEIFIMHPDDAFIIDSTERLFTPRDVLMYFSGLIVENQETVRLAHFSIKEYLVSSRIQQHLTSTFSIRDIDAHLFIACSCFSYFSYMSALVNEGDKQAHPLKAYASSNCLIHLEMVPSEYWHADVINKLVQTLAIRSQNLLHVISGHFMKKFSQLIRDSDILGDFDILRRFGSARLLDLHLRPYCLAAYQGFVRITGCILSQAFSASKYLTQGDLNTALWYAVYGGRKEVAVLLLDRGADPNTSRTTTSDIGYEFEKHGDVLQIAVSKGDAVMVNLLLDRGADIDAQRWGSALQTAVEYGCLDILKLLVRRGANINGPSNEKGSVLSTAIQYDDLECFQFLLDSGADINMLGTAEGARTALCEAARYKCRKQFELLLRGGADVNIGGEGGYPLEQLIELSYFPYGNIRSMPRFGKTSDVLPMIERLLSLGANPNAQAKHHHTALHAAVAGWGGDESPSFYLGVAKLLIDRGADVNIRACTGIGNEYATEGEKRDPQSLLYHCAYDGSTSMAQLLLENGASANVNLQAGQFGNALQAASSHGHIEMMQLLLDHGAEVNSQGGYYGTALNAACQSLFSDHAIHAVRLLLEHGADVNIGGGEFGSALQTVCARFIPKTSNALAQILLDYGADVNARGGRYGTALQAACVHSPTTVQLLLDRGANVNAEGGEYGTALQAACVHNPSIVQLLLDYGADVNAEGGNYGTSLQAACARSPMTGRLLLDHGANVNAEGGNYGTALQVALHSCHLDLVQLLVDRGADVNANGGPYGSCLQIACANGRVLRCEGGMDVIRTLLQRGADPLIHKGQYPNPFHSAAVHNLSFDEYVYPHIKSSFQVDTLLQLLLGHGAELNLVDDKRGTALHYVLSLVQDSSLSYRWQDGFETWWIGRILFLLDHGADANLNLALQAAAYSGQLKTVQLLLRRKDHIIYNERHGKYGSALNAAVIRANWDILDVLLEAGAKPDCHMLQEPDEEFLARIREEHGWAAEERYKKFWEVEKRNL